VALKTKIGGRESDSFITVAEADTFLEDEYPDSVDDWDAEDDVIKEAMVRTAAQLMRYLMWRGRKVYCGQALSFPRTCQDRINEIPIEIRRAQAFIAYGTIWRAAQSRPDLAEGEISASRVTQVSLGGLLSVSFSGTSPTSGNVLDRIVRSVQFPIFAELSRYLTQFRGRSVPDEDEITCSTTTTTTSTTSTTVSTSSTTSTTSTSTTSTSTTTTTTTT